MNIAVAFQLPMYGGRFGPIIKPSHLSCARRKPSKLLGSVGWSVTLEKSMLPPRNRFQIRLVTVSRDLYAVAKASGEIGNKRKGSLRGAVANVPRRNKLRW